MRCIGLPCRNNSAGITSSVIPGFILILFLVISACWKHQEHGIIEPEIPNYILSGTLSDINSGEIIPASRVILSAYQLVYSGSFSNAVET